MFNMLTRVCNAQDITTFVFWFLSLCCEMFSGNTQCCVLALSLTPGFIISFISRLVSYLVTQSQIFLWKEEQTVLLVHFINETCHRMMYKTSLDNHSTRHILRMQQIVVLFTLSATRRRVCHKYV